MDNSLIPQNNRGKQNDLEQSMVFTSREEAGKCFARAHKRLLNPKVWHKLGGALSGDFALVGEDGEHEHRLAQVGDYYRIDMIGPGTTAGQGYDWVKVELIEEATDAIGFDEVVSLKLRACSNPNTDNKDTAHFLQGSATSTFIIHRKGHVVIASYHGRNEVPNTHTDSTLDNMRNAVVASGAVAGLSEANWTKLIKAFLQEEIGG